jgi:hypothetical protein
VFTAKAKAKKNEQCCDWAEIVKAFDSIPTPSRPTDFGWIFRGHKSVEYSLQPSIEREAEGDWATVEAFTLKEFRSKARMHIRPSDVPQWENMLDWLALMRHSGVPTRLLDFTFSPYIALYFALPDPTAKKKSKDAEVWAIDADALGARAASISRDADHAEEKHKAEKEGKQYTPKCASLDPSNAVSEADEYRYLYEHWDSLTASALAPSQIRQEWFNKKGFVAPVFPSVASPRLSSQQGVFLYSGADELNFQKSLFTMMNQNGGNWYRLFRIPAHAMPDVERELFKMNIHDLSLFPDLDGLAGFVRQKARLQCFPNNSPSAD